MMNLDGGIHEVPLPGVTGRLWLCGKHAIAPNPQALMDRIDAHHVVCLVERFELLDRYPLYVEWLETSDCVTWFPIPDLDFVSFDIVQPLLDSLVENLRNGHRVVAHCAAGIGRAGTLAVAICQKIGMPLDRARDHVRWHRPGAGPEVGAQEEFVQRLSRSILP